MALAHGLCLFFQGFKSLLAAPWFYLCWFRFLYLNVGDVGRCFLKLGGRRQARAAGIARGRLGHPLVVARVEIVVGQKIVRVWEIVSNVEGAVLEAG